MNVKLVSNILFALSFLCALLILVNKTYGYKPLIQNTFLVAGGIALVLSLVASRTSSYKDDFNLLFWLGSLIMFIGFVLRFQSLPGSPYLLIGGLAISALSNFYNPFQPDAGNREDDELLDR